MNTNNEAKKKNKWKQITIFFTLNVLLYPLLIYVIVPYIYKPDYYGYLGGYIFYSFFLLIMTMLLAHLLFGKWWIGIVCLAIGLFFTWTIYTSQEYYEHQKLHQFTEYYYDTDKISERGYKNYYGEQGEATNYDTTGKITSIITYNNGRINGKCQLFYLNEKLKATGNLFIPNNLKDDEEWNYFRHFAPDGKWTYYREDGTIDDERKYDNGKLLSSKNYTLLDNDSIIININNRKPYTGILNKTPIINKNLFPIFISCQVVNGYIEGVDSVYHCINGKYMLVATATYQNQKLNGEIKRYHENGQLQAIEKYINGQLEKECVYYYADSLPTRVHGNIEYIGNYKNGKRNGTARWFFENGKLDTECDYIDGIRNGIEKKYRENGKLISIYHYKNNSKDGNFEEYYNEDSYRKGIYNDDQCISFTDYDKHGKPIK